MVCHIVELSIVVAAVTIYGEVVACCSISEQQPHRLPQSKGRRAKAKLLFITKLGTFDYSLFIDTFHKNESSRFLPVTTVPEDQLKTINQRAPPPTFSQV
jgi:hypothetical protein